MSEIKINNPKSIGLRPNPQKKPNTFWNKNNSNNDCESLLKLNDIIIKKNSYSFFPENKIDKNNLKFHVFIK